MSTETYTAELLESGPEHFMQALEILATRTLFSLDSSAEHASSILEPLLRSCYEKWRIDNGVTLEFASDIQYLLKNQNVRQQLATTLFQNGVPKAHQLETTLRLLILASYSRHITVRRTFKPHTARDLS